MIRAKTEELRHIPWFAKAGAACSIVPISRFVGPNIFALKGGGYGCLFSLSGLDEEGLTDQELESRVRSIEGSLRGLPEGSCLYQYTRVMSGFDLPRQKPLRERGHGDFRKRPDHISESKAGFRRIDLHWCLTIEPSQMKALGRNPMENTIETSRLLFFLQKTATIARRTSRRVPSDSSCSRRTKSSSFLATSSIWRSGLARTSFAATRA